MIQLRPYQRAAIDAIYRYFETHDGNPLVVAPTGAGKSIIQAAFQQEVMSRWGDQRLLLLTHVKELLEQNGAKLLELWPDAPLGFYSAGMRRRDTFLPLTMASIQSVHKRAEEFGHVDLVIIDEAHLVPTKSATMYRRFLDDLRTVNPHLRVIGMTATPFRLDQGFLHRGDGALFTDIAYDIPITRLIAEGHLVPPVTLGGVRKIDMDGVKSRGGEFVARDLVAAVNADGLLDATLRETVEHGKERRCWLLFCPSVEIAQDAAERLTALTSEKCVCLHGGTPKLEREQIINDIRAGQVRAVTNCDVLTTGFDAPIVDMIVFLRPTKSTALYIQMVGRGLRTHPGKENCLVLDFAGNVARHGPVDAVDVTSERATAGASGAPQGKECPRCQAVVSVFARECDCGHKWPIGTPIDKLTQASRDAILTSQIEPEWLDVNSVTYRIHEKPGRPDSLRVNYLCGMTMHSEWVCIEHGGFAERKARQWFDQRTIEWPETTSRAFNERHSYPTPSAICIRKRGRYTEIIDYRFTRTTSVDTGDGTTGGDDPVPDLSGVRGF